MAARAIGALAADCSAESVLNDGPAHRILKRLLSESARTLIAEHLHAAMQDQVAKAKAPS